MISISSSSRSERGAQVYSMNKKGEFWSSRVGFILASMGSAIELGSIWKFPYEVGANGGGGFVLFYLIGLGLIVLPLMLVEFSVGRRGRADAMQSINVVAQIGGASRAWSTIGVLGVVTSCLILSYYSVVGGWALAYTFETVTNTRPGTTADAVRARYDRVSEAIELQVRLPVHCDIFRVTRGHYSFGLRIELERTSNHIKTREAARHNHVSEDEVHPQTFQRYHGQVRGEGRRREEQD